MVTAADPPRAQVSLAGDTPPDFEHAAGERRRFGYGIARTYAKDLPPPTPKPTQTYSPSPPPYRP